MGGERILVVDDDPKIRKVIQHCLIKEGFEIVTAADGEEALEAVAGRRPDLIILDLMLPKISGLDVINNLTAGEEDIPIVILSAKGEEVDRIVGFRMGVDDYLAKPFNPIELVLRVKAVLRRVYGGSGSGGKEGKVIACGDFHVDTRIREVLVRGRAVALTSKEFDLLLLFAGNPLQVFTRRQLLSKVWQSDYEGDEMTVTVHIRRLREKIEPDPSRPRYIQTVWGVGYRFEAS